MTTAAVKAGFAQVVRFLNHPAVKEGVKNIASTAAFAFGLIEAYDIYQILRGREISTETDTHSPKWIQVANKIILLCAKISLILSAATSRPGVFIISTLVGQVFSSEQLEYAFGPNTTFAMNPWHPRHVCSIAAVILALPSVIQSIYRGMHWVYNQFTQNNDLQNRAGEQTSWLTDRKTRLMALINTVTSRPTQHICNQLCRTALRA